MADYRYAIIEEIAAWYRENQSMIVRTQESRRQTEEIVLIPYSGSASDFTESSHYTFRMQQYTSGGTTKQAFDDAWDFYEHFKNNYRDIRPQTYRIHFVKALDQPGPAMRGENANIFYVTNNYELLLKVDESLT